MRAQAYGRRFTIFPSMFCPMCGSAPNPPAFESLILITERESGSSCGPSPATRVLSSRSQPGRAGALRIPGRGLLAHTAPKSKQVHHACLHRQSRDSPLLGDGVPHPQTPSFPAAPGGRLAPCPQGRTQHSSCWLPQGLAPAPTAPGLVF